MWVSAYFERRDRGIAEFLKGQPDVCLTREANGNKRRKAFFQPRFNKRH